MEIPATEDQPRSWIQKNYASFNGIRGLAVLGVYGAHFLWIAPLYQLVMLESFGSLGVDLFFVLSGFLITGILFDVIPEQNYFRNFYIRRALRIFPLFYGLYLLLGILCLIFPLQFEGHVPAFLFYVGNFFFPQYHSEYHLNVVRLWHHGRWLHIVNMGHFWTLCVEEQFYLLWPAVVFFVRDRKRLLTLCVIGIILAPVLRTALWIRFPQLIQDSGFVTRATYARCDSLLVGAFLALYLRGTALSRKEIHRASNWLIFLPGSIALLCGSIHFAQWHFDGSPFTQTIGYSLIAFSFAGLLLRSLDNSSKLSAFFRNPLLARLGIVSYGFYVIHDLPAIFLQELEKPVHVWLHAQHALRMAIFVGWFVVSWLLAEVSFRFFEQRFLRLKNRFAPERKKARLEMIFQDATK